MAEEKDRQLKVMAGMRDENASLVAKCDRLDKANRRLMLTVKVRRPIAYDRTIVSQSSIYAIRSRLKGMRPRPTQTKTQHCAHPSYPVGVLMLPWFLKLGTAEAAAYDDTRPPSRRAPPWAPDARRRGAP